MGRISKAIFAAGISLGVFAGAASANDSVTVLRSTAPAYKAGDMLTEGQSISVPQDRVLEVISISGVQARISDYVGPLRVSGRPVETSRLAAVTSAVLGRGEGTTAIGGTRGIGSHVAIDLTRSGHWCVADGVPLVVARGDNTARETMTMKNRSTGRTEMLKWSRFAVSQDWPDAFAVTNGASFTVDGDGAGARTITLHVLPSGQSPTQHIFALARHQCTAQMEEAAAALNAEPVE